MTDSARPSVAPEKTCEVVVEASGGGGRCTQLFKAGDVLESLEIPVERQSLFGVRRSTIVVRFNPGVRLLGGERDA